MTATQARLLWAAGMFLVAWLFREEKGGARVTKEILIDANVDSNTFGEPISTDPEGDAVAANHARLLDLVEESNAAIAAYDVAHPELLP